MATTTIKRTVAQPLPPCYFLWVMCKEVRQWLERVKYDLSTARAMLKMRKYLYAAFMCQQAVEKALKTLLVRKKERVPFIHNLRRLAVLSDIEKELDPGDIDFLEHLTPFAIKARYGSYKKRLSELCDRNKALEFVRKTERFVKWLEGKI